MQPFLEKLKQEIEKGSIKRYGTFVLVFVTAVLLLNVISGDPVGNAIQPKEKTCEEIKGTCSLEPCGEGYLELKNYCPNQAYCCKQKA